MWNWLVRHLIAQGVPKQGAEHLSLGFALGMLARPRVGGADSHQDQTGNRHIGLRGLNGRARPIWSCRNVNPPGRWRGGILAGLAMAPVFPDDACHGGNTFPVATATAMGMVITCGWIGLT